MRGSSYALGFAGWLVIAAALFCAIACLGAAAARAATDRGPVFFGGSMANRSSTWYAGRLSGSSDTDPNTFWMTPSALGSCHLTLMVTNAPGAGKSWDATLRYKSSAPAAGSDCGDEVGSMSTATGTCTISGATAKNCDADITFAASPAAASCLQLVVTRTGSTAGSGESTWTMSCTESGGADGISTWSPADTVSRGSSFYAGTWTSGIVNNSGSIWILPYAIGACTGGLQVETVPGATATRSIAWYVSSTGLSAGAGTTSCGTLSYSAGSTLCTIGSSDKQCAFSITNTVTAPAFGCAVYKATSTNSPASTGGETWHLGCSADSSPSYTAGGRVFASGDSGGQRTSFNMGPRMRTNLTGNAGYWLNDGVALDECDIGTSFTNLGAGTGTPTWTISIRYSTAAKTTAQRCNDLTYTTTNLCTLTVGTHRSCTATNQSVSIVAGGCFQLRATA
ncbi:MAG: hypothetical protein ACE5EX_11790, partial [Phycisphaerae bacterium]